MELSSILKVVVGGAPFGVPPSVHDESSLPLPRSGTVNDFGVDGGDEKLITCFDEGSNTLTSGFVINPNACTSFQNHYSSLFHTPRYHWRITPIKQPFPFHYKKMTLLHIHQKTMFSHVFSLFPCSDTTTPFKYSNTHIN